MAQSVHMTTDSAEATRKMGRHLGRRLDRAMVIAIDGELGAGKTVWVQGLAKGLDVPDAYVVTSPSYTLVNEYPGRLTLYHVDLYRLAGLSDLEAIGLEEILDSDGIVAIEWAERLLSLLPEDRIDVRMAALDAVRRKIDLFGYGRAAANLIKSLGYS